MGNVFAPRKRKNVTTTQVSVNDPRVPRWLGVDSAAGVPVTAYSALGISAFWRGSLLISSSIAGLPLATVREWGSTRDRVSSWLDNPAKAVGYNAFNWKQTSMLHLVLGGDSFQRHLYNGLGMLAGVEPVNPNAVEVYWDSDCVGGKRFEVSLLRDGVIVRETHDAATMTQVMGPTLDGLRGLSVIGVARTSLGGAIAADVAAATAFRQGPMIGGIATPSPDGVYEDDDAKRAQAILDDAIGGTENAGKVVFLERKFDFTPFGMTLKDQQFLESRQFTIQDVARWLGVHPVFLMDPGAVSTWGTGVEILQRGLGRFTLPQYTDPFQEAMSNLLPNKSCAEWDFTALERGSPSDEIDLIIKQVDGGLMTINQALAKVNRPGIGPQGDILRLHGIALNPEVAAAEAVNPTSAVPAPGTTPTPEQLRALMVGA